MLKVFLVEDEFIVREGMKHNILWNAHGYEFCGEAGDGELAFPMIQKLKPDIVITDIKMPFMDGIELSRLVKKELPNTEIILLTGYAEFGYAKEAIKIGVAEYLSKPINGEELLKAVDNLAVKIRERKAEEAIREKYLREMEENSMKARRELFQRLVSGSKSAAELLELAEGLQVDLSAIWYNVALIKIQSVRDGHDGFSGGLADVEEKVKKLLGEWQALVFERDLEGKALILKADTKEELEGLQAAYREKLTKTLEACPDIRYFGGIGTPVNRLRELPVSFENASRAFAHRYLVKESRILDCREIGHGPHMGKEGFHISQVDPKQISGGKIREFLRLGEAHEAIYFVTEFFRGLGASAMESSIFRQYIVMDAYFCVMEFLEELGRGGYKKNSNPRKSARRNFKAKRLRPAMWRKSSSLRWSFVKK